MSTIDTRIGHKTPADQAPHAPTTSIPKSNVWDAIEYVRSTIASALAAHLADTSDAHDASAISFAPAGNVAATDVQTAIAEVATDAAADLTAHTGDATAAHAASAISFTPAGALAATDVQGAIAELDGEKQPLDSDLTSWAGVTRAAGFDAFAAAPSSANLRTLMTDESGSGALLFADGALGTPASGVATNLTGLPLTTGVIGTLPAANGGTGVTTLAAEQQRLLASVQIGKLTGANFNSTADQAITITNPGANGYVIDFFFITNASTSLTTAAGGIYTSTAKGGAVVLAEATTYSTITGTAINTAANGFLAGGTRLWLNSAILYFSLTTPQGSAATADVYVFGRPLY
jgi:hypothetical protein